MVTVTPRGRMAYANQDISEQQALLSDLSANPRDYLAHPDAQVRSLADWTMEYWGLRTLRYPLVNRDRRQASEHLTQLYKRLQDLAV